MPGMCPSLPRGGQACRVCGSFCRVALDTPRIREATNWARVLVFRHVQT